MVKGETIGPKKKNSISRSQSTTFFTQKSSLARLKPQVTAPKSAFKLCNLSTAKSNTGSSLGSDHRTTDW